MNNQNKTPNCMYYNATILVQCEDCVYRFRCVIYKGYINKIEELNG